MLHVTYAGNRQYELKEGTYALVPAKTGHKAHCAAGKQCVMFIRFDSPIDASAAADVPWQRTRAQAYFASVRLNARSGSGIVSPMISDAPTGANRA